ncbi:alpha/beta hydrolase [Oceanobacillus senegalensis]|uniref:alpha/beta hydrolase n=1 Tax=Oceanobacillus senegalensis TaxID=1936063 RepID=UPI000A30909A|nr:hypothetical protein [Oceanobacillus senegalensis]
MPENRTEVKEYPMLRGIVSMNGYVPSFMKERYQVKPVTYLSVFLTDGELDPIFPPKVGQQNYEFFKEEGAYVLYKTYETEHEIGEENKLDVVEWLLSNYQSSQLLNK